jgi:hypothetical protein
MPYPGSDFTTISGKIKAFTSGPTTERLLIIGTALDGPLNVPVRVTDAAEAERIFGPATYSNGYKSPITATADDKNSGATIPRAIAQAIAGGCTDIYVCRATGNYATAPSAFSGKLDLKSSFPGRLYNDVSLGLQSPTGSGILRVTVTQPSQKGETYTTSYASALTVAEVIDLINGDRRNRTFEIIKDTYASIHANACTTLGGSALVTVGLSGGTYGTNAPGEDFATSLNGYASALAATDFGTFDQLLGQRFRFNVSVLTGIHLDDQVVDNGYAKAGGGTWSSADEYQVSVATDYVLWLDRMSQEVGPCFGVVACRPPGIRNVSTFISFISGSLLDTGAGKWNANLRWNKAGYFMYTGWSRTDNIAGTVDMGQRLGVVAGPEVVFSHPKLGNYTDMFHVSYAAMLTTLPPERAPIFKQLPGVVSYGTPIPAKYANKLVQGVGFDDTNDLSGRGAYTVLTRNPRDPLGPMVIYDDVTAAYRDDYMRNYQLVHLCNSIHNNLDYALGSFIGGPTSPSALAAMETVVQNIMDGYVASNALRGARGVGYDFRLSMTGTDEALGVVRIFLEISPATALRKIYFVVAVRQNA